MKFKIVMILLGLFILGGTYFSVLEIQKNVKIKAEKPKTEKIVKKEPPKPIPKVETSKYSNEQIEQARNYVGNYLFIKQEVNKETLRCISLNESSPVECEILAKQRYKMSTDPASEKRMHEKYLQQVAILKTQTTK